MQSLRHLKKRIRSVRNVEQITKAMEVVSMNKMRKSQSFALAARPYATASLELLENLLKMCREIDQPELLRKREIRQKLLVVITADKGLAGAFNESVLRKAQSWIDHETKEKNEFVILSIGKKAKDYFERKKIRVFQSFYDFGDYTHLRETSPVADVIMTGFLEHIWDSAEIVYTHFRTTLRQETVHKKILPVTETGLQDVIKSIVPEYGKFTDAEKEENQKSRFNYEYKFEPGAREILDVLVPSLLKVHIHHIILESNASEHSARMIAMKNANQNAKELGGELTLTYNKGRQAGITGELLEIISGQASVGS